MKKKTLKRILSASLALMIMAPMTVSSQISGLTSISASATVGETVVDSGLCGETASYTLTSDGVLIVSGSGSVSECAFDVACYLYADSITSVEFAEGSNITSIDTYSFNSLPSLETVTIPATVTFIGDRAFGSCPSLVAVNIDSAAVAVADSAFGNCGVLTTVNIASDSVKVHPYAFSNCSSLETMNFTAHDGTTIQGAIYGLAETVQVTMQPFSKIYKAAGKYFTGPSVAYDTYQPQYDHAVLYWEDTESIIEAAQADEAGVRISDSKESLAWITNENISTYFPSAQCSINGTMEGDGSFANPYLIYTPQNWRYLDYLGRTGKLSSSYYGWDRGTNVKLMADLTLSDRDGTFTTLGGDKHREVYNNGYAYSGNFDGNGHTITLDVNESIDDGTPGFGLIERTDGAYIKNLHISGRMVSSQQYTGLLVGYIAGDHIYNCSSDAELVLSGTGEMKSGALVGYAYRPYIENCHFTGKILGGNGITAVGGFVGQIRDSSGGSTLKNCYFAPSQISVSSEGSCILYRPYYGSYAGWCGFEEIENNYYNAEALKLNGDNMGGLDQGASDAEGIDSLNETEFWDNGQLTMSKATASANPGTRRFAYTGGEHRIFMDLQADAYHYSSSQCIIRGDSFPYMPGYAHNGTAYYKVNDGDWSATPPLATEVGEYTVYYRVAGDAYHRDSDIQSIQVTIEDENTLPGSGTAGDPYTISNDLEWSIFCDMRDTDGKYFKLVNDIVVSEDRQSKRGPNHPLEFNGFFDGDGHTITLYYVSRGSSDSLFGKLIGIWSYDTASYKPVCIKNLIVNGVMYSGGGENSPIAYEITHNATVSNIISNMTIVNNNAGGDRSVSGIVNTGSLSGGAHFFNCKVGGKFSASGGDITFAGLTNMNDFWQSGTDFIIKDCYVNPTCEDIKVSASNYVIVGNYKEEIVTIENTFFGQSILGIIPVDEETGETTNTQGISDENGLDALYATGYWADGNPTMPKATITKKAPAKKTIVYTEQEPVYDPETGEEIEQEPTQYPLLDEEAEAEGGTIWYSVNGGEWTTEIPSRTDVGMYFLRYKAVGDYRHRDSDEETTVVTIVPDWATPTGLTVSTLEIPYEDFGTFSADTNASVRVEWDELNVNSCNITVGVITSDGTSGILIDSAPVDESAWYELNTEKPSVRFFLALLGKNEQQTFTNGRVNGIKYGDTVYVYATGVVRYEGCDLESAPCESVDFSAGASNSGKTFPVFETGLSNDSGIKSTLLVKGDKIVVEGLASGGMLPYQYEVKYKRANTTVYTKVQDYSTNQIVSFKPATSTLYDVRVSVKDAEGNIAVKDFKVDVRKVLANLSEISENTIVLGESAVITADSEGGIEPREYQVKYRASGSDEDILVQDYSTNSSISITPEAAGTYTVYVTVKDSRNVTVTKTFDLTVNKPLENNSAISSDLILLGDNLIINAASEGGLAPVQYEIALKNNNDSDYTVISEYGENDTLTVVCDTVGEFTVHVNAKDCRGTVVTKELALKVHNTLSNTTKLSDTVIVLGGTATLTFNGKGGKKPYEYQVLCKFPGTSTFETILDYCDEESIEITPDTDGVYKFKVNLRDSLGVVAQRNYSLTVNKKLANLTELSAYEIVKGDSFTVNAASEGGLGDPLYAVYYKRHSVTSWTTAQNYTDNTELTLKPAAAEDYDVVVKVKDTTGTIVRKAFTVKVNPVLENTSVISAEEIVKGGTVTVSASATGGMGNYQYTVLYKQKTQTSWTTASAYSENSEVVIKPGAAVEYDIAVKVKSADKVVKKTFTLSVIPKLENKSVISSDKVISGKTLTVTCTEKGGKAPCQYEVSYRRAGDASFTTVQEYSDNSTVELVLTETGSYEILVNIKDSFGQTADKTLAVEVYEPLVNTSVLSGNTLVLGTYASVTASAQGGIAPYEYEVLYKKSYDSKYTTAQSYSSNAAVSFKPAKAETYDVRVNVKDSKGNIGTKDMTIRVYSTLTNTSTLSSTTIDYESSTTVKFSSTGGLGTKLYRVDCYDQTAKKWTILQSFSASTAVSFKPSATGNYTMRTMVKDETGTIEKKDIVLNCYGVLVNTSTISTMTPAYGSTVTVNASCTGFKGTPQYSVMYYNSKTKTWYTATTYSTNSVAKIQISLHGTYTVRVKIKDSRNTAVTKDFKFTV